MEIDNFSNGFWLGFSDEEMSWYYELIGDWVFNGIYNYDKDYTLHVKKIEELGWR